MAEIDCKKCASPDCEGCNTFILEVALKQGKFDALMDGNRTIHIAAVVLCGECKYMMPDGRCYEFADPCVRLSASDFCSYGQRKEDGNNN